MKPTRSTVSVKRIVSGGQTGVDRGALDAAIALGIEHGGWCPRGRLAEDGRIPDLYCLEETSSTDYWVRTEKNVVDSDGTLIIYSGQLRGGTELTHRLARKHGKPCLLLDLQDDPSPRSVRGWIGENGIEILNVAGPRASSVEDIDRHARRLVKAILEDHRAVEETGET